MWSLDYQFKLQLQLQLPFGYYSQTFCSKVFAMLLVQQLCHAFLCEKANKKYSISTITYGKISKLSSVELNTVILSLVIVNKTSIA